MYIIVGIYIYIGVFTLYVLRLQFFAFCLLYCIIRIECISFA